MRLIKVAAAALNQTPLDWDQNCQNIFSAIEAARDQDASILCLPELCITGYGCEDAFQSAGVRRTALSVLEEVAPATAGMIVSVGLPISYRRNVYNAACLLCDGRVVGFVGKQNLAGDGIHYEPRWFRPWPANTQGDLSFAGQQYPLGDLVFDCGGIRIGFEICEDAWVADRPGERLSQLGVDVILNPSASHFAFGKNEVRRKFVLEGSQAFDVSYVYSNLVGNESGRAIYDGETMIASGGAMLAEGRRFSFTEHQVTSAVVDIEKNRMSSQVRRAQQEQLRILSVSEKSEEYGRRVEKKMRAAGLRVSGDYRAEKLGAKIRDAQLELIPYMCIVGPRDAENDTVSLRDRIEGDLGAMKISAAVAKFQEEIKSRTVRQTFGGDAGFGEQGSSNEY